MQPRAGSEWNDLYCWQAVAAEIEKNHKVKTKVITLDFTEQDAVFEAIAKGIQVNNIFKVVFTTIYYLFAVAWRKMWPF